MLKNIFTSLVLLMSTTLVNAQSQQVKGKVFDKESSAPMQYASVVISTADSTIVAAGATAEDGSFSLNAKEGNYRLTVSFMSYKDYKADISVGKGGADLGSIELEADAESLQTAVVQARRPVIESKLDKLIMNVSEAATTQGSNARDVLCKAPGVAIDKDGNVTLNGQAVAVWIDGRPSNLSGRDLEALLKSTDASTLDKLEIMAHPSAKYDAAGSGGIIDIKLKKNHLKGLNGSVNVSGGGWYYDKFESSLSGSLNLGYRSEKGNTSLIASSGHYNSSVVLETLRDGEIYDVHSVSSLAGAATNYTARLSHDWFANDKNTFGAIVSFSKINSDMETPPNSSYTHITRKMASDLGTRQISDISNSDENVNYNVNLNYTHYFDKSKAQELTFNANYGSFNSLQSNSQNSPFVDLDGNVLDNPEAVIFNSDGNQKIKIIAVKGDYQQTVGGRFMLEAGGKYAHTFTGNENDREDFTGGVWLPNEKYSSLYDYREDIAAAYGDIAGQFGKWVVKAGLRSELTHSNGDWKSISTKSDTTYIGLFPTIYFGFNPNQNFRYGLSYSRRIGRPSYNQLNPQVAYIDATNEIAGNPYLNPSASDNIAFTFGFKSWLNANLICQNETDMIMQRIEPTTGAGSRTIYDNFGRQTMVGATIGLTEFPLTKWMIWNINLVMLRTYSIADDYKVKDWLGQGYVNCTFLLPKDFKIELGGSGRTGLTVGYVNAQSMADFYFGIKKEILKKKGTIALKASNPFYSSHINVSFSDAKETTTINQDFHSSSAILSFSYRFGNVKAVPKRKVGEFEESNRVSSSGKGGISID